jgi:GMP synthase (glutamine-hydrolysing)
VFEQIASTENIPVAAFKWKDRPVYGIQFHPEVTQSEQGKLLLANFIIKICGASH